MPSDDQPHPASSASEHLLRSLRADPSTGAQSRVRSRMTAQMRAPRLLAQARESIVPDEHLLTHVWSRITSSIDPLHSRSLWESVRASLRPGSDVRALLWDRFSMRLEPASPRSAVLRPFKWVAAFAVVLIAIRLSPLLFLAPGTIADSPVTLLSPDNDIEVLMGSLWNPMRGQITLRSPTQLQTQDGQASIVDHDDAVFRLDTYTKVDMMDLSDRPQGSPDDSTIELESGQLWTLGLVPDQIRGIIILTSEGRIVVHEGSVSVSAKGDDQVVVQVLDRGATVLRRGKELDLVAGEQAVLTKDGDLVSNKMDPAVFQDAWVSQNLSDDASHRREISELQQERRAAAAGILPGSPLYAVKRFSEQVDVLLSLSPEERAQKLVAQANTRLNEAAALLADTGSNVDAQAQAQNALQEYKQTVLSVASGSGSSPDVQSLIQNEVVENGAATVSAALPGDPAYALKQAVDDTIAALPDDSVPAKPDVASQTLLDQLAAVKQQAEQGDTLQAKQQLSALGDSLDSLNATGALTLVPPDVRDEAKADVDQVEAAVQQTETGRLTLGAPKKDFILPMHPPRVLAVWPQVIQQPLSPAEISAKAEEIRGRVFVFDTQKARYDALDDQLTLLQSNPDRGSILRELEKVLPMNGLAQRVLREIRIVHEQVQEQVTASGGTAPEVQ